ncbi:hypothetical protein ABPG77_001507 [Micractinium sp. CCAP 211/92]
MGACCSRPQTVDPLPHHDTHRLPNVPYGSVIGSSYPGGAWTPGPPVAGYPAPPEKAWRPQGYGYPQPGTYYQPGPGPYASRYRPGVGPGGAAALGASAGLLGGVMLADAMTPDVVQQTTIYEGGAGGGGDWGGGGGGDLNSFNDFSGGDYGGGF